MVTLRLLKFDAHEYATQTKSRTAEIERAYIDGCPPKLLIYRSLTTRNWWVRYYWDGRVHRKSTKQTGRHEAIVFAKSYYDTMTTQGKIADIQTRATNFTQLGMAVGVSQRAKLQHCEINMMTFDNFAYRYQKSVLPFFCKLDVTEINYQTQENYVTELSDTGISGTTIRSYLLIVRKVSVLACRRGLLLAVPEFPAVKIKLKARGWFSPAEYLTLYRTARRLAGVTMEICKFQECQSQCGDD